jgi:hypothetical protein
LKVRVNEQLKGEINEKQIEVYIGWDCRNQVGGAAIYKLKKAYIGDSPFWVADQISYSMNNYSEQERKEVVGKLNRI